MHPSNSQVFCYRLHQYLAPETDQNRGSPWIVVASPKNELLSQPSFATQLLQTENG